MPPFTGRDFLPRSIKSLLPDEAGCPFQPHSPLTGYIPLPHRDKGLEWLPMGLDKPWSKECPPVSEMTLPASFRGTLLGLCIFLLGLCSETALRGEKVSKFTGVISHFP